MSEIILTPEQASILAAAEGLVAIRRPDGSFLGWVSPETNFIVPHEFPFTPEEIAAAEREADSTGPWRTTKEVLDHLRSLDQTQP